MFSPLVPIDFCEKELKADEFCYSEPTTEFFQPFDIITRGVPLHMVSRSLCSLKLSQYGSHIRAGYASSSWVKKQHKVKEYYKQVKRHIHNYVASVPICVFMS